MKLRSGLPFSLIKYGLPFEYPKLDTQATTDVLIMGGGISGALVAYHLIQAGVDCMVIDKRSIGLGSTCASTSLLQYELDIPLSVLIKKIGKDHAVRAYQLCNQSINHIKTIAQEIGFDGFENKDSLYFAARKNHWDILKNEFEARKENGFNVEWLEEKVLAEKFGLNAPAGILSHHGAQADAYLLTHHLLQWGIRDGLRVFDRTCAIDIEYGKHGVRVKTENGFTITAGKLVYATGYEAVEFIREKIVSLHSTYAIASENGEHKNFLKDNLMMWNSDDPYLYLRSTKDGRIIIGGRDEKFDNPVKRDRLIEKKCRQLTEDFKKLFPHVPFNSEFSWTGTFGTTKDSLPYIGSYPKLPHGYFALGFGGNGITFSEVAAAIIADLFTGKKNEDAQIFSFDR
ncbi:MAG: FAD-binding oxidoreductase [Chitinophagales bacterium]